MSWYRAGTVTVTNGSTTVTGSGTAFIANAGIGEGFIAPDGRIYEIVNIPSDTSLTISPPYLGSTASGQGYAIAPLRGRIADLLAEVSSLYGSFVSVRDGIGAGLMADGTVSLPGLRFGADQDTGIFRSGNNEIGFAAGGAQIARVNATGVAVNTNNTFAPLNVRNRSTSAAEAFDLLGQRNFTASPHGAVAITVVSDAVRNQHDFGAIRWEQNPATADGFGALARFFVGGESSSFAARCEFLRGTANTSSGGADNIQFFTNNGERLRITVGGIVRPGSDNSQAFGEPSFRWSTIFAATGTINTSDAREKHWRGPPEGAAIRAANRIIADLGFFQWSDAVEEKGEDGARWHFGVKAQDVVRIMIEEGLEDEQSIDFAPDVFVPSADRPRFRHAFLCFDTWGEPADPDDEDAIVEDIAPGNRFGLRIDQLTMFLLAALASRVAALESKETA